MPRTTKVECPGCPPIRALTFDVLGLVKVVEARSKQGGVPKVVERWGDPDSSRCVLAARLMTVNLTLLFNYGIGIHLLENESMDEYDAMNEPRPINPKDNHISFQCTDVGIVKRRLEAMGMRYATAVVEEGGIQVDQVFFHDPDGYMIEICNCDNLPVLPISSPCPLKPSYGNYYKKMAASKCELMEIVTMKSLSRDMMNFSF